MKSFIEGRSSSSETSSDEETNHQREEHQDDSTSSKRSYDCTFCRRGFTNAQALGGHMNIHRKDKAKAKAKGKQLGTSSNNNLFTKEEYIMAPNSFIPHQISSQASSFYSMFESSQGNFYSSNNFPNRNPPSPAAAYAFQYEFLNPTRYESLSSSTNYQELLGPNLSLQIGPSHHVMSTDEVRKGIPNNEGDVVDLELRLSHYPYNN
ncbi:hypothetical protein RIF29_21439 [Crotalaria pallida]|uniref:C2H2-type domain-containing protein n=1 Tax=Crotalaria pallida TaxID=3830 RepID=A0AAN9F4J3_CROPI